MSDLGTLEGINPNGLETLCFRPLTRQHAALTRIQVAYGPTLEEQRYVTPEPTPTTAPNATTGTTK